MFEGKRADRSFEKHALQTRARWEVSSNMVSKTPLANERQVLSYLNSHVSGLLSMLLLILLWTGAQAQPDGLSQYNLVWTSQSENSGESMPCGGGRYWFECVGGRGRAAVLYFKKRHFR